MDAQSDPNECRFPDVTLPHIATPLFIMQGRADATMDNIVGVAHNDAGQIATAAAQLLDKVSANPLP